MNAKGKTSIKESKTKITASTLMRLAGVSAMVAGLCFIVIGMFHPVNEPSAVNCHLGKRPHFCDCPGLLWTVWHGRALRPASGKVRLAGSGWLPPVYRLDDAGDAAFPSWRHLSCRSWRPSPRRSWQASWGCLPEPPARSTSASSQRCGTSQDPCISSDPCCLASLRSAPVSCHAGRVLCLPSTSYWSPSVHWFPLSTSPRSHGTGGAGSGMAGIRPLFGTPGESFRTGDCTLRQTGSESGRLRLQGVDKRSYGRLSLCTAIHTV